MTYPTRRRRLRGSTYGGGDSGLGPELRGTGQVVTVGSPAQAGTYNVSTGVGFSFRTAPTDIASTLVPGTVDTNYRVDVENTDPSNDLRIRQSSGAGAILATVSSGSRETLTLAFTAGSGFFFAAPSNGAGVNFTIHSVREVTA